MNITNTMNELRSITGYNTTACFDFHIVFKLLNLCKNQRFSKTIWLFTMSFRLLQTRTRRLTALTGITSGIKLSDRLRLEDALSTTTYISSQESESDDGVGPKCLAVKKLTWRSDFLDHWFTILDADHVKNDRCLSRREKGEESHRPPPTDGPSWAVKIPK